MDRGIFLNALTYRDETAIVRMGRATYLSSADDPITLVRPVRCSARPRLTKAATAAATRISRAKACGFRRKAENADSGNEIVTWTLIKLFPA